MDIYKEVQKGNFSAIEEFLQCNPSMINTKDEEGYTLLHHAVMGNYFEITRFLIEMGADISITEPEYRRDALKMSEYHGFKDLFHLIQRHGIKIGLYPGATLDEEGAWKRIYPDL